MSVKNMRHGRIRVLSGDATPLEHAVAFAMGNFTWGESYETNEIRDRGVLVDVTKGDDQPVSWSFSARFEDRSLLRVLRDKVWPDHAETITGLTGGANNAGVDTAYDYEQGTLAFASSEPAGTKLAEAAVPATDNEFSEAAGTTDVEGVDRVLKTDGFNVFQPAADVDRAIVYNAVGKGTLGDDDCAGSRKTFKIKLEIFDPCDPPDPFDLTAGTIIETMELDDSYLTELSWQEGDDADEVRFAGRSLIDKVVITTV